MKKRLRFTALLLCLVLIAPEAMTGSVVYAEDAIASSETGESSGADESGETAESSETDTSSDTEDDVYDEDLTETEQTVSVDDAAEEADVVSDEDALVVLDESEDESYVDEEAEDDDQDELFAGYVDQLFEEAAQTDSEDIVSMSSLSAAAYLSGNDLKIYTVLKEKILEVASGEASSTVFTVTMEDLGLQDSYTLEELGVDGTIYDYSTSTWDTDVIADAKQALSDLISRDLTLIHSALLADCPYELYWYDKTAGVSYSGLAFTYSSDGVITITTDTTYTFYVSSDYQDADASDPSCAVDADRVSTAQDAAENAAAIVKQYASLSDEDKLEAYMEAICDLTSYDSDVTTSDSYGDPWQIVYVFDGDDATEVVCEGYSKAFKYLCDMSDFDDDIDCYIVNGTLSANLISAGTHMWNIVTTSDGNYLVDVTNCDAGYTDALYMTIGSGSVSGGYTFTYNSITIGYTYNSSTLALYDEEVLLLHEHDLSSTGSSCTGQTITVCSLCGKSVTTTVTATGHSLVQVAGVAATCTEDGYETYYQCENCGEIFADANGSTQLDAVPVISATGHTYSNNVCTSCGALKSTSLSSATVTLSTSSYTYNGSARKPSVTVKVNGTKLTKDTDYTVTYASGRKNVGTYKVTIKGIGNYSGTATATFTIVQKSIASTSSAAKVTLSTTSYTYNGSARKPTPTVKITLNGSSTKLTKGTDYTVSYKNNTSAGTATVTIKGTGNYKGTLTATFTIVQKSIASSSSAAKVTLSTTSYTYNGSARKPTPTVKITLNGSSKTLKKGTDYTVSYKNNTSAGTATVTIKGTGNYKGTLTKTFKIQAQTLKSSRVTLSSTSYTYSGSSKKPSVTVKNSAGSKLKSGTDYTVTYKNNKSIGKATVTIKGKGNYTGTITKTFKINPKKATISSVKSSSSKKITVKWSKVSGSVTKYQVRYRVKGTSTWTTKTVSSSTLSKTLTGLKSGKTYEIQVRAYKTVSGTKYYGSWSTKKTVKCK